MTISNKLKQKNNKIKKREQPMPGYEYSTTEDKNILKIDELLKKL